MKKRLKLAALLGTLIIFTLALSIVACGTASESVIVAANEVESYAETPIYGELNGVKIRRQHFPTPHSE